MDPRLLWRLGVPALSGGAAAEVLRLDDPAREALLLAADDERMFLPAAAALQAAGGARSLPAGVRPLHARRTEQRAILRELAVDAAARLDSAGVSCAFLKGSSVEQAYGDGAVRQCGDVDIAVPSLDALWEAVWALSPGRLRVVGLSVRRDPRSGRWCGSAALADGNHGKIEIVAGAQPATWATAVPFDEAFWAQRRRGAQGLPVPGAAHVLALQLCELFERGRLRMRDLADVSAIAGALDEAERAAARTLVEAAGLGAEGHRVVRALRALGDRSATDAAAGLAATLGGAGRWGNAAPRVLRMATRDALGSGPLLALGGLARQLASAARRSERLARALTRCDGRLDGEALARAGLFVTHVPVSARPRGPMAWARSGEDRLLRTPIGVFLALPLGVSDGTRVVRARAACAAEA